MTHQTSSRRMDQARRAGLFVQLEGFTDLDRPVQTMIEGTSPVPDANFYDFLASNLKRRLK